MGVVGNRDTAPLIQKPDVTVSRHPAPQHKGHRHLSHCREAEGKSQRPYHASGAGLCCLTIPSFLIQTVECLNKASTESPRIGSGKGGIIAMDHLEDKSYSKGVEHRCGIFPLKNRHQRTLAFIKCGTRSLSILPRKVKHG